MMIMMMVRTMMGPVMMIMMIGVWIVALIVQIDICDLPALCQHMFPISFDQYFQFFILYYAKKQFNIGIDYTFRIIHIISLICIFLSQQTNQQYIEVWPMAHMLELDSVQQQFVYQEGVNWHRLKKILQLKSFFQANSRFIVSPSNLTMQQIFTLKNRYKLMLIITFEIKHITLEAIFIKDQLPFKFQSKAHRLIFERSLPKFTLKTNLTSIISEIGTIKNKFSLQVDFQYYSNLKNGDNKNINSFKNMTFQFINQSALLYKTFINKLDNNLETMNSKPSQYFEVYKRTAALCNSCFLPAFSRNLENEDAKNQISQFQSHTDNIFSIKINQICKNLYQYPFKQYSISKIKDMYLESQRLNFQNIFSAIRQKPVFKESQSSNDEQISPENKTNKINKIYTKIFINNLKIVFNPKKTGVTQQFIYNEIEVKQPRKIQLFPNQNRTTNIQIIRLLYSDKATNDDLFNHNMKKSKLSGSYSQQTTMVIKSEPLQSKSLSVKSSSIQWQKCIIQNCFKNKSCIYLPRFFFFPKNFNQEGNYVCSEFMKKGTLRSWLSENGLFSSLCSKTSLLLYILYGLTFIHQNKVLHLDLKPENILMDKHLITKITDFGSAFNKEVHEILKKKNHHYLLSYSPPYTAPQIFMKRKKPFLSAKCDIYSLGFIIYETIFNGNLLSMKRETIEQLYQKLGSQMQKQKQKKRDYQILAKRIFNCPQNLDFDQSKSYSCLLNLVFRCISVEQKQRPSLDWIIILMKQIYFLFLEYYAW